MVRKGQTYSMDLIIGAVIFILLVVVFLALLLVNRSQDTDLRSQIDSIFNGFDTQSTSSGAIKIFNGNNIDRDKLIELFESDYATVKRELGIRDDFCIIFTDSTGGLIGFDVGGETRYSFGHPGIKITPELNCGD
jgi:hypothetical protein